MSDAHGKVWWTELLTRDVEAAKAYYERVCGWTFEVMPMADGDNPYHIGKRDGAPVIGIMDMTGVAHLEPVPPHWFSYFAVEDVDAAMLATVEAGGSIRRSPFEVPGIGRIMLVEDPTGAAMGLMTPAADG